MIYYRNMKKFSFTISFTIDVKSHKYMEANFSKTVWFIWLDGVILSSRDYGLSM